MQFYLAPMEGLTDREEDLRIVVCFQPFMAGAFFQLPGSGR